MSLKIFPATVLDDGKKIPLINDWENNASSDPAQIEQWQQFFRERIHLWACPTGVVNDIYVLDIDVKDGVSGFDSLKDMGVTELPHTAFQNTPSGGMHLIFKYDPNRHHKNTVNLKLRLDTRGDGGFIWLYEPNFTLPFAPIPAWIDNLVKPSKIQSTDTSENILKLDPTISMQKFNDAIDSIKSAGKGERNHTLNTQSFFIGQLVASGVVSRDYAYQELKQAALSIGLSEHETQATINSGLKGGDSKPITHPFGDMPPEPVFDIPVAPKIPEKTRWTPNFGTRAMLFDWSKLKKPQLFENWSTEDIHLTSAIGGVGKTTIKLFEAVCLALGQPFLGFKCVQPGRTLIIIGEDSESKIYAMIGRILTQLGFEKDEATIDLVLSQIVVKRSHDITLVTQCPRTRTFIPNMEALHNIYESVDDLKPRQIIFDPIAMFWGAESGGNDMAMALSKCMQQLQEYSNASIDMISHISKDSNSKRDLSQFSARGGTALANHSRVIKTYLKLNDDEYLDYTGEELADNLTAIYCYVSKFTDGSPLLDKPFIIIRDGTVFTRKDIKEKAEGETGTSNNEKERVFNYIKTKSTEEKPITMQYVCDYFYLQTPKISKTATRAAVSMLILDGVIEEVMHGDETIGKWLRYK